MSLQYLNFTCSACSFYETSLNFLGRYLWVHNGEVFQFETELACCSHCESVVIMERLPEQNELRLARDLHSSLSGKWINPLTGTKAEIYACQTGFSVLEFVMGMKRSPVCLRCGLPRAL